MIGWFLAGAWLGLENRARLARRDARRAEKARKRREEPMSPAVWVVYGIFAVASLFHPAAIAGTAIVGVLLWRYTVRRGRERAAWLAEQADAKAKADAEWLASRPDPEGMAS